MKHLSLAKLDRSAQNQLPGFDDLIARLQLSPESGQIWLGGKRMFMLHLSAFGALRRELIESLGVDQARGLLTRMGYLAGSKDAELVNTLRKDGSVYDAFVIGPQLHAMQGVVRVEPVVVDVDVAQGRFYTVVFMVGSRWRMKPTLRITAWRRSLYAGCKLVMHPGLAAHFLAGA